MYSIVFQLVGGSWSQHRINTAKDVLQRECVAQLYKPELFSHLLLEANDIKERRIRGKENLKTLRHAVEILNQVRDFHVS